MVKKNVAEVLLVLLILSIRQSYSNSFTLPLFGNYSLKLYHTQISIGNPPQSQKLMVDTGSHTMYVFDKQCQKCGQGLNNFDITASKTAILVPCYSYEAQIQCQCKKINQPYPSCQLNTHYLDELYLQGYQIKDQLKFPGVKPFIGYFGKVFNLTGRQWQSPINGIMGLSRYNTKTNILFNILNSDLQNQTSQKFFSICLSKNGGVLSFKFLNKSLHTEQQVGPHISTYQDDLPDFSLSNTTLVKIGKMILHQQLIINTNFVIDSGSTITSLPFQAYNKVLYQLRQTCYSQPLCQQAYGQKYHVCFHIKGFKDLFKVVEQNFPPIQMTINGSTLKWPPLKYFLLRDIINREICLGIKGFNKSFYLLGANWMVDRNIVFDLSQNKIDIYDEANCLGVKNFTTKTMQQMRQFAGGYPPLSYMTTWQIFQILIGGIILIWVGCKVASGDFIIIKKQEQDQEAEQEAGKRQEKKLNQQNQQQNQPKQQNQLSELNQEHSGKQNIEQAVWNSDIEFKVSENNLAQQ